MTIRTQITIDIDGLDDATVARIRRAISGALAATPAGTTEGWTIETALELIRRLESRDRPVQAAVLRRQLEKNGVATRDEVYALGNYEPDRQLKGFTRAVNTIVRELKDEGLVSADSSNPMTPLWEFEGETSKSALAFGMSSALVSVFAEAFRIADER
jgi:hypothetical protein